jgi:transposase
VSNRPWIVDDELRAVIEPVLPKWPERSPGPRPVDDRRCLQGVLFVLYTGITWQQLPLELGFGSGQTWWHEAGVFDRLHRILLAKLNAAGQIDWTRACVDASHVKAKKGRGAGSVRAAVRWSAVVRGTRGSARKAAGSAVRVTISGSTRQS